MMKMLTSLALALPLSLGFASIADAHPGGRGKKGPMTEQHKVCREQRMAKMKAFDANGDGAIDRQERRAARKAKREAAVAKYDRDGDGVLSDAERNELRHDRKVTRFEALDTNRDASISKSEADAACGPIGRKFARVDTDGSGQISWDEFEKAGPMKKHHRRGKGAHGGKGKGKGKAEVRSL